MNENEKLDAALLVGKQTCYATSFFFLSFFSEFSSWNWSNRQVFLVIFYFIMCIIQVVFSKFQDLVPKSFDEDDTDMQKPDEDKIKQVSQHQQ